jgi:hypothetical protein
MTRIAALMFLIAACVGTAPVVAAPEAKTSVDYLEARVTDWLRSPPDVANVKCAMSCHTTLPYMFARGYLAQGTPAGDAARRRIEERVRETAAGTATPFYGRPDSVRARQSRGTEAVVNAAALALDDRARGRTSEVTATALDQMWRAQRSDGGWDWLDFDLAPWQSREDWALAVAALAAGRSAPVAKLDLLRAQVRRRLGHEQQPVSLHDRAALLWASASVERLVPDAAALADEVAKTQRDDGGFSLRGWAWGGTSDSDGYATALGVLALCHGTPNGKARPDVRRGLAWLEQHRAADGTWPGRSVAGTSERSRTFMTDAATSYALLARATCR